MGLPANAVAEFDLLPTQVNEDFNFKLPCQKDHASCRKIHYLDCEGNGCLCTVVLQRWRFFFKGDEGGELMNAECLGTGTC